jgi:hypothetical protein
VQKLAEGLISLAGVRAVALIGLASGTLPRQLST